MRKSFILPALLGLTVCWSGCASSERPATSASPNAAPANQTPTQATSTTTNSNTSGGSAASANMPDSKRTPPGIKPPQKAK